MILLVGPRGFELPTSRSQTKASAKLKLLPFQRLQPPQIYQSFYIPSHPLGRSVAERNIPAVQGVADYDSVADSREYRVRVIPELGE